MQYNLIPDSVKHKTPVLVEAAGRLIDVALWDNRPHQADRRVSDWHGLRYPVGPVAGQRVDAAGWDAGERDVETWYASSDDQRHPERTHGRLMDEPVFAESHRIGRAEAASIAEAGDEDAPTATDRVSQFRDDLYNAADQIAAELMATGQSETEQRLLGRISGLSEWLEDDRREYRAADRLADERDRLSASVEQMKVAAAQIAEPKQRPAIASPEAVMSFGDTAIAGGAWAPGGAINAADVLKLPAAPLREAIVVGLLRVGEIMNVIAAPKVGKSWFALLLALSIAAGVKFLGAFETSRRRVLILDNELHEETIKNRLRAMLIATGIDPGENLAILSLRGRQVDINAIADSFHAMPEADWPDVVVGDAAYRIASKGTDENSNADITAMYNILDQIAREIGAAIVLIHHTSKGSQSQKSVTDTGAGAGAQSRAADTHIVLRQHSEEGVVVLDGVTRSFREPAPICIRAENRDGCKVWTVVPGLDPKDLKTDFPRKGREILTAADFAAKYVTNQPADRCDIVDSAAVDGVSERRVASLLKAAQSKGLIHQWAGRRFATVPAPEIATVATAAPWSTGAKPVPKSSNWNRIAEFLAGNPGADTIDVAGAFEVSPQYVRRIRKEVDAARLEAGKQLTAELPFPE